VDRTDLEFSVVICAYTEARWDQLCAAVDSVHSQTVPASRVVVVVDHNPALFVRARERFAGDVVIENAGVRGLSDARNSGIDNCVGDVVAFLDDDAAAQPEWLASLAGSYADSSVLGVGGHIEPLWETARPGWFPEEFDWVIGCTYRGAPTQRSAVRNMIGANMSFRRPLLVESGGFRHFVGRTSAQLLGDEETELCIRITRAHPGVFIYEPTARVVHNVPASRVTWSYFSARCYAEGISKGVLSRALGSRDGLSSERRHVLVTLPKGVGRALAAVFTEADLWGVPRAATIVGGLAVTVAGYLVSRVRGAFAPPPS